MITHVKMMFSVPRVVGPDTHPGSNSSCEINAVAVVLMIGVVLFMKVVVFFKAMLSAWRAPNVGGIAHECRVKTRTVTRIRPAHGFR